MSRRLKARTLFAAHYRTGETWAFEWADGKMQMMRKTNGRAAAVFGPGFVDLQCNGYAGVDFNRKETEPVVIAGAIRAMWEHGCTEVLPTVITAAPEKMTECLRDVCTALDEDPEAARSVLGFHIEGPFLSPVEGARGAHPAAHICPVSIPLWRKLQKAADERIRMVTVAPEVRGALDFIRRVRSEGIIPAMGHTLADFAAVRSAADAGALLSTHLGNGCPTMLHRHTNPIFAQLAETRLAATFIADGIHLPPEVLRVLWAARGATLSLLVTDAMAAAGAPPGIYSLGEIALQVGADRVVRAPGKDHFAGSALTMNEAVANSVRYLGISLTEAWDAASVRPWELLRSVGAVRGNPPSLVLARWAGGSLEVLAAMRGRRVLWERE